MFSPVGFGGVPGFIWKLWSGQEYPLSGFFGALSLGEWAQIFSAGDCLQNLPSLGVSRFTQCFPKSPTADETLCTLK